MVEVFSGFLNIKITKELVIFKDKCRVGPHIPLQMNKFNVSQDIKAIVVNKMVNYFTSEVAQQMAVKSKVSPNVSHSQQMTVAIRPLQSKRL